jgi:hypothetical protein
MGVKVHTNPDVKVLWNIMSELDVTKDICSCVIDCEVVKYDPMEVATGIVERARQREKNGFNLLPRKIHNKENRTTPELEQEDKDGLTICNWKQALKGKGRSKCSDKVRNYLDINLPGWREEQDFDKKALVNALEIVERAKKRVENNGNLLPQNIQKKNRTTPELKKEYKDAKKLGSWKNALKGKGRGKCFDDVRDYLDQHLPGWRVEQDFDKKSLEYAIAIVERAELRAKQIAQQTAEQTANSIIRLLPRRIDNVKNRKTTELKQQHKDAVKLGNWKTSLKGIWNGNQCSDEVRDYLDEHLPNWRDEPDFDKKSMEYAVAIVERAKQRQGKGLNLLPRQMSEKNRTTTELEEEYTDALKLCCWKK